MISVLGLRFEAFRLSLTLGLTSASVRPSSRRGRSTELTPRSFDRAHAEVVRPSSRRGRSTELTPRSFDRAHAEVVRPSSRRGRSTELTPGSQSSRARVEGKCKAQMRIIAFIQDAHSIKNIMKAQDLGREPSAGAQSNARPNGIPDFQAPPPIPKFIETSHAIDRISELTERATRTARGKVPFRSHDTLCDKKRTAPLRSRHRHQHPLNIESLGGDSAGFRERGGDRRY